MFIVRTVSLTKRDDGVYINRLSTCVGGYSFRGEPRADTPSFTEMAIAVAHFTKHGYAIINLIDTTMLTMQREVSK